MSDQRLEQWKDLKKLQEIDFVLVELNLYLDTHHHDQKALDQYNYYAEKRKKIARSYEEKYGPLLNFGQSKMTKDKQWWEPPWPWQL